MRYADEFGSHLKNTTIGIAVKGEPRIFIQELLLEPDKLTIDTEGLFMITLINTGTESAEDVKISISGADDILTEGHQFIGEIAPGESQTTTFGVSVDEEAKIGKHGLKISISYEDKFGTGYSNSKIYEISKKWKWKRSKKSDICIFFIFLLFLALNTVYRPYKPERS